MNIPLLHALHQTWGTVTPKDCKPYIQFENVFGPLDFLSGKRDTIVIIHCGVCKIDWGFMKHEEAAKWYAEIGK